MDIKQLYNDNLRKLPNKYGDVSVMVNVSNELNFSDVYRSVNYIGSLAKFT